MCANFLLRKYFYGLIIILSLKKYKLQKANEDKNIFINNVWPHHNHWGFP